MNRHFHNTLSAMSATAVMLAAVLIVAAPAHPLTEPARQVTVVKASGVAAPRKLTDEKAIQAQADEIEIRAERLAAQLQKTTTTGETLAHVAAFTAEVATVTALTAVLNELPDAVEAATAAEMSTVTTPVPARRASKHKRSRQSLAMPYFSFASRS